MMTAEDTRYAATMAWIEQVLVPTVFIRWWRELDRRSAAYTASVEPRVEQDTTGDHIWDA